MKLGTKPLMVFMIVIGMPVASYVLLFKPLNSAIKTASENVEHREALLVKLQEETARNSDLERANEEIERSVKFIESRLPSGKDIDDLVRQVSDYAVSSGLKPPAMRAGKPVPAALYMEQPIEMEVIGSYLAFSTFIAHVEKLPRIVRIHDLKLSGQTKDENELKAEFTLSIYFQDQAQIAQGETSK
jgi:type IV pilus assembly protein PilO